jgi:nucleotide-binding universal stress UspA family protein
VYKKILVGYDGSAGANTALRHAVSLARDLGSEVWALWVKGSLPHYPEMVGEVEVEREAAEVFFQKITEELRTLSALHGIAIRGEMRSGHPAQTLLRFAEAGGFELIVLGHKGHSGLWGRFLGHTADKVSENAHCSVLIVREE